MTNNELITQLLTYDGWEYEQEDTNNVSEMSDPYWYNKHNEGLHQANLYLTDMNILHRIAVKVVANISGILDNSEDLDFNLVELNSKIVSSMFTSPNEQGEHIQLATAIVNAIRYISENKAG